MTYYIAMCALLLSLALFSTFNPDKSKIAGILSSGIVLFFAGLRYETGHDWIIYQSLFNAMPNILSSTCEPVTSLPLATEPLYSLLNILIKSIGGDFSTLLFAISLINVLAIHFVSQKISKNVSVVWIFYFGIVFLMAQMTLLRQSLASSFVLISLLFAVQSRPKSSGLSGLAAVGFQFSSAIFLPLIALSKLRIDYRLSAAVVIAGVAIATLHTDALQIISNLFAPISPNWLAYKLSYYAALERAPITMGSLSLIVFHVACLVTYYAASGESERGDRFVNMAIWLTILVLVTHLYLSGLPTIWNRVMMVSVPWQIATLFRLKRLRDMPPVGSSALVLVLACFSFGALAYSLSKPNALPFVPYQSIVGVWITGDAGDGRERLERTQREFRQYNTVQEALPDEVLEGGNAALEWNQLAGLAPWCGK